MTPEEIERVEAAMHECYDNAWEQLEKYRLAYFEMYQDAANRVRKQSRRMNAITLAIYSATALWLIYCTITLPVCQ